MSTQGPAKERDELVLLPSSHWASNIGNPFFTLGAEHLLNSVFDDARVLPTDQFSAVCWDPSDEQLARDLKYPQYADPDWYVMCGPMMSERFVTAYETVFDRMDLSDTNLVLLSVGSIEYSEEERTLCRSFLEEYQPEVFFTRDKWTYDQYHDLANYSYDGIDLAFFAPDYYPGYPTPRLEPYVTFTFDKIREPSVSIDSVADHRSINIGPVIHDRRIRKLLRLLPNSYPEEIDGHRIVRPTHGVLNQSTGDLYSRPNAFFSQTPYGYLNLYRNTELTLSDRVHACVPTVAYGGAARLLTESPRARLFERVGLGNITEEVVTADSDRIDQEKKILTQKLTTAVN